MRGGWKPIETAPKDGTPILVHRGLPVPRVAFWNTSFGYWGDWFGDNTLSGETHWMPLPDPPEAA